MAYHFKNLVFEGGGVKGIAYIGTLRGLEEREMTRHEREILLKLEIIASRDDPG